MATMPLAGSAFEARIVQIYIGHNRVGLVLMDAEGDPIASVQFDHAQARQLGTDLLTAAGADSGDDPLIPAGSAALLAALRRAIAPAPDPTAPRQTIKALVAEGIRAHGNDRTAVLGYVARVNPAASRESARKAFATQIKTALDDERN